MSMTISEQELFDNPTARVAICLVLDIGNSMNEAHINELNQGVQLFFDAIRNDDVASYVADISIVTFGNQALQITKFSGINYQQISAMDISTEILTTMGSGINVALDAVEARIQQYRFAGIDYFRPWLFLISNFNPTDHILQASTRTSQLIDEYKLTLFTFTVGDNANLTLLKQFFPKQKPLILKSFDFKRFLEWELAGDNQNILYGVEENNFG